MSTVASQFPDIDVSDSLSGALVFAFAKTAALNPLVERLEIVDWVRRKTVPVVVRGRKEKPPFESRMRRLPAPESGRRAQLVDSYIEELWKDFHS